MVMQLLCPFEAIIAEAVRLSLEASSEPYGWNRHVHFCKHGLPRDRLSSMPTAPSCRIRMLHFLSKVVWTDFRDAALLLAEDIARVVSAADHAQSHLAPASVQARSI